MIAWCTLVARVKKPTPYGYVSCKHANRRSLGDGSIKATTRHVPLSG